MPEYLAPGVYIEETSFRSKSIEGVSTTTTGFVGPTRYGPIGVEPEVVTSLGEYERVYGDGQPLEFVEVDTKGKKSSDNTIEVTNFMWHAARAFFAEGGKRLYVSRVFDRVVTELVDDKPTKFDSGCASTSISGSAGNLTFSARWPGSTGAWRVRLALRLGQNILTGTESAPVVRGLTEYDVVYITDRITSPLSSPIQSAAGFYVAVLDRTTPTPTWKFEGGLTSPLSSPLRDKRLADLVPATDAELTDKIQVVSLKVSVAPADSPETEVVFDNVALDRRHARAGSPDSIFDLFEEHPTNPALARQVPITITAPDTVNTGDDVLDALFRQRQGLREALSSGVGAEADRSVDLLLTGGNDGRLPTPKAYEGDDNPDAPKVGLKTFEDLEDISIVAAPGATYQMSANAEPAQAVMNLLIGHCQRMRYRIAVLDSGDGQTVGQVRALRYKFDSSHAALYYPWVRVLDPITNRPIHLPPSGFVAGIYARNDIARGVYKAPANEVVTLATGFEQLLNKAQQEVLNPEGVNCFRYFEGRGYRLWGARTVSSDSEWKYVNLRRYFAYLERSIERGTQFAVFEPNGDALWANIRRTIEDFLLNEWQQGALLGEKPEKAFFVRCDRSTMTQNDLDNGRLVCLIGVAPLRPAEFVIFRIGQFTADRRS